jgi:hypothetical protein
VKTIGTYRQILVFECSLEEYWSDTSLQDRLSDDRYYLVHPHLIYQGYIVAEINAKGYIQEVSRKKFERPAEFEINLSAPIIREEKKIERGKRAETGCLDDFSADSRKIVDEYLASKKSVDYFFEELKKGT